MTNIPFTISESSTVSFQGNFGNRLTVSRDLYRGVHPKNGSWRPNKDIWNGEREK